MPSSMRKSSGIKLGSAADVNSSSTGASRTSHQSGQADHRWRTPFLDPSKISLNDLMIAALKYGDLGHVLKPLEVHIAWSQKITKEFWLLGDSEKAKGIPISPLCDREKDSSIAKAQVGFLKFVCLPYYEIIGELVTPNFPPLESLLSNQTHWQEEVREMEERQKASSGRECSERTDRGSLRGSLRNSTQGQEEQEPEPEDEQLSPRRSSARLSAGDSQSGSDPPLGRKRRSSMRRGSEDVKVPQTVEEGEEGNASFKSGRKPSTEFSAEVTTPPAPP